MTDEAKIPDYGFEYMLKEESNNYITLLNRHEERIKLYYTLLSHGMIK
jgi:hypothetical protein